MRTTLTLDDDVAALLRKQQRRRKGSFKAVVNDALRLGLNQMEQAPRPRKPYRTRAVSLGRCRIGSLDDVAEALAMAEGESFR
jgi:hypothetical protein